MRPLVPTMFKTAYRLTGHRADAEDLVQDVLTKLFTQTAELADVVELKPWVARVLHNRFIDTVRARQRSPETVAEELGYSTAADSRSRPEAQLANNELANTLHNALDTLSPEQRSLVVLHLMEGHKLIELTDVFEVPLGTLKSRLHTARSHLKKVLKLDEPFTNDVRVNRYELPTDQTRDSQQA